MREMKDCGIEWAGNIPNNWIIKPYRNIITQRDGGAWGTDPTEDNQMICMRIADFDYEKFEFSSKPIENLTKRKYTKRQILNLSLQPGDILIEKSGGGEKTPVGRAVIFDKEYPALFANFMDRIRVNNNEVIPRFVVYWLGAWYGCKGSPYFINQTTGIQNIALTLFLAKAHICYPKLEEQRAIVDFLDAKCADIDSLTGDIQKQIDILKEYKKSVITQAVTKGIDPNVEMKDSGVAWIGKIPMTWHIVRLKYLTTDIFDIDHYMPKDSNEEDSIPYLMIGDLRENLSSVKFSKCKKISKRDYLSLSKKNKSQIGDVVFARYATIGTVCYIDLNKNFLVSYACLTIKPKKHILGKYLYYYLKSNDFYNEAMGIINANTQGNIGKESLRNVGIVLPNLQLQEKIINFLDSKCADIDAAIAGKQKQLDVLKEYKKSLIYEDVTGKKEVPCRE